MSKVHFIDARLVPDEILTPGFSSDIKPARPGIYLCRDTFQKPLLACPIFRFWSGKHWHFGACILEQAQISQSSSLNRIKKDRIKQDPFTWYGLLREPT